ncbi:hypothetical protein [Xanthomonas campestris]|uniref:hypothetical protein n=1 Tax=Xanthomonas campestris TaxID=339 RepID=UPI00235919FD|nr:hypothetical protein [Xanthomonas campestris]MDC8748562.1 hypothetical protein [Xanthomonas campestris]WDJ83626.1 hypothetical protein JH279_13010 [Xanthomonas campestris pv. incanae]WDJ92402.1 hypothetical protein JH260_12405 [Xanthomonas campestris pv. incanae]WDK02660.1 hypothetical protein JH273_02280 [Xanthomonas campestris]WDK27288.1 hypothetical protein JH274_08575 [Xanthomonas campestris pv. incanae]
MYSPPSKKKDVVSALQALHGIERPGGDNEGDPINSPAVYPYLSQQDQALVDHAERITNEYVRKQGDEGEEANQRSLTELNKAGFSAGLGPDQYDPYRLVGGVEVGDWTLNLSDPNDSSADD